MKAVMNHLGFEFKSIIRDKTLLLMNYLFPLAFYFMMAAIMPGINPDFGRSMIPAMIAFTITVSSLLGMPTPFVAAKEKGIYRSYKIYGVPLKSVLFIPAFSTIIHITIISLIIYITGLTVFHAARPENLLYFCGIYGSSLFALNGLGLLLGVCSPNSRITVLLAQLIFLPSMMLGGIMMPSGFLPGTLQKIGRILPVTHAMNAFRALTLNQPPAFNTTISIVVLLSGGLLAYLLAAYLFTWDPKNNSAKRSFLGFLALAPFVVSIFM